MILSTSRRGFSGRQCGNMRRMGTIMSDDVQLGSQRTSRFAAQAAIR